MKRGLLIIGWLLGALTTIFAQSPTTITGVVQAPNGAVATSGYVEFQIQPSSSAVVYYVSGTTVLAPQTARCGINASGQVMSAANLANPCTIWPNTLIVPGNTTYTVVFAPANRVANTIRQVNIFGATYSLNSITFAPVVRVVPQYQTITTFPIAVNLVPAAAHVFDVGSSGVPYAAGYFDQLIVGGVPIGNGTGTLVGNGVNGQLASWTATTNTLSGITVPTCGDATHALAFSGGVFSCQAITAGGVGTVTSIATSGPLTGGPITGSGTIGCTTADATHAGCVTSTDWNTFNNKLGAAVTSITVSTPLTGGPITGTGTIGCQTASDVQAGCLSAADHALFNSKGSGNVTGSSLTFNRLVVGNGGSAITLGDLSGDVTTSGGTVTLVGKVNGVSYPSGPSVDQTPVVTATNTITYKSLPDCADTTHALAYTVSTHTFSCQAITAGGNVSAGGTLTSGQLLKGNGGTALTTADLTGDVTTSGGVTTTVVKVNGVAYSSGPSTDTVAVITAAATATYTSVPLCGDATHALAYDTATHMFSCQAITGSAAAGGSDTEVQYNNTGAAGGVTGVTSDGTAITFSANALIFAGSTSGSTKLNATAIAGSTTLVLPAANDTLVARDTTDTLTNKTLGNSNTVTFRSDRFTLQDNSDTTKQAVFSFASLTTATTRTYSWPDSNTTVVGTNVTQTLTNKTLDNSNTINARDDRFILQDDGDPTKQARFQVSGISPATTRTFNLPDANTNLVSAVGALPSGQLVMGQGNETVQSGNLSGDVTTSGSTVTVVVKVNGVTYSASPATNTTPVITASNVATYKVLPNCGDFHNALAFATGSSSYSCQAVGRDIVLGSLTSANFNSTADQAITLPSGTYIIREIIITNASTSLTTAAGGIYTAASKGGSTIVAASQTYSTLTGATVTMNAVLDTPAVDTLHTEGTLYLSLTTAQGATATGDLYIIGDRVN